MRNNVLNDIRSLKKYVKKLLCKLDYCDKLESQIKDLTRSGIVCPMCGSFQNRTIESKIKNHDERVRRRECLECGERWNTLEILKEEYDFVKRSQDETH